MAKHRLDQLLASKGIVASRSQAESYIKLGRIQVNGKVIEKSGFMVAEDAKLELLAGGKYVSRAGLKLASVTEKLSLDFKDKTVLDVGSSTGGFTDFALQHGAKKIVAVDVGTNQLHPSLQNDDRIELHEQTDIRDFTLTEPIDYVLIDVSFISLREVLPHIAAQIKRVGASDSQANRQTLIAAMVKPQFEAGDSVKNRGVIKNDSMRRNIIQHFETWAKSNFVILDKADSDVTGAKGNRERFYLLKPL